MDQQLPDVSIIKPKTAPVKKKDPDRTLKILFGCFVIVYVLGGIFYSASSSSSSGGSQTSRGYSGDKSLIQGMFREMEHGDQFVTYGNYRDALNCYRNARSIGGAVVAGGNPEYASEVKTVMSGLDDRIAACKARE